MSGDIAASVQMKYDFDVFLRVSKGLGRRIGKKEDGNLTRLDRG
jgi:hypothetical protein